MRFTLAAVALSSLVGSVLSAPTASDLEARWEFEREIVQRGASDRSLELLAQLQNTQAGPAPQSIEEALASITLVLQIGDGIYDLAVALIAAGFAPGDISSILSTYSIGDNSPFNINLRSPQGDRIFPKKSPSDAPYSIPEIILRGAIRIPSSFTYGQKPPLLMVPGTGSTGGISFGGNFRKLFKNVAYADPVWLNIPGFLLNDAQENAEFVAYAINYISGISQNKNVSVIAWSQGNLDAQWAFKYWPSTRAITSDLISISPDFHGTVTALPSCPGYPTESCNPAIVQQDYNSNFITTLRSNGGDSAYVPTTTIYTNTDQVVQPQDGTGASAYLLDARGVGVTNNQIQTVCPGLPPGVSYSHEGMLFNPVSHALAVDALTNPGPGQVSRINMATECLKLAADGLTTADIVATEGNNIISVVAIIVYPAKVNAEPPIKAYAA
ncbi:alpha/beta-hydrolase [Eremomyces bilateralis CBS 781.70]|uniref:Alpha/beta-hydrolase n=1 Tax=Eremomyces bilateralis CBS 781.70 TaxID=1392243 RepID=A0A6G1GH27_9PEZI|nr:alpha/beta-hydrolase [Eremomyces bilateralis CBS 781.70]KAF1817353.1 alpha/beta-hydrolase [Eremomyces bilateralis CBS 781.70]